MSPDGCFILIWLSDLKRTRLLLRVFLLHNVGGRCYTNHDNYIRPHFFSIFGEGMANRRPLSLGKLCGGRPFVAFARTHHTELRGGCQEPLFLYNRFGSTTRGKSL